MSKTIIMILLLMTAIISVPELYAKGHPVAGTVLVVVCICIAALPAPNKALSRKEE